MYDVVALGELLIDFASKSVDAAGYPTMAEAAAHMGVVTDKVYRPNPDNTAMYDRLYREYLLLHDTFGRGENDVMKRLRQYREEARSPSHS